MGKSLKESNNIPKKYQHMVKDFYKGADGYWVIELNDGYTDGCGYNYIWQKTKKDAIDTLSTIYNELQNDKGKLEEVSRNELKAKAKMQTISRYKRSDEYMGFEIVDIDTTSLLTTGALRVTCKVGKYWDTVEMENVLWWIQLEANKSRDNQVNNHVVRDAILNAIDGMDIKVDCNCGDFIYRFAYGATQGGYKYGKPENRPAKITNPNNYGSMCKHLIAMLRDKKWLQKVAAPVMDWIVKRIEEVNRWLKVKPGEELTLPDELARRLGKQGAYTKLFNKTVDKPEEETEEQDIESNKEEQLDDNQ